MYKRQDQLSTRDATDLPDAGMTVLRAIHNSKYVLRTKTGISKQSGLDTTTVIEQLNILKKNGLVSRVERSNGERWAITASGQRLVEIFESRSSDLSQ